MTYLLLLLGVLSALAGPAYHSSGATLRGQTLNTTVGATAADPGSILQSSANTGGFIVATLQNPTTVTDTPDEGARWSVPIRDAFGTERDLKPEDAIIIRLWLGDNGLPPDATVWAAVTDGPVSLTSLGVAVGLHYTASGPVMWQARGTGVSWSITSASAAERLTVGAELQLGSNSTALRLHGHVIDAVGDRVATTNSSPAAEASSAILGPWDTLTVGVGWRTGVGGTSGATVSFAVDTVFVPASRVASTARDVIDTSSWRTGSLPRLPTNILVFSNSSFAGAASGPTDTVFSGTAVQAGATHRVNNAAVATYGARPGVTPYLIEELIADGITTPRIAVEYGSGFSADDIYGLRRNGVSDGYSFYTPTTPRRIDAIIWQQASGNNTSQAGIDEFAVYFPLWLTAVRAYWGSVPIFVGTGTIHENATYTHQEELDALKTAYCAAYPPCYMVDLYLDPSMIDGTDHPTVNRGGGNDTLADRYMSKFAEVASP